MRTGHSRFSALILREERRQDRLNGLLDDGLDRNYEDRIRDEIGIGYQTWIDDEEFTTVAGIRSGRRRLIRRGVDDGNHAIRRRTVDGRQIRITHGRHR